MARVAKKEVKDTNNKNIILKKSGNMFDVYVSDKTSLDYFGIKPNDIAENDKKLSSIIKTKCSMPLNKTEIKFILTKIRENTTDANNESKAD